MGADDSQWRRGDAQVGGLKLAWEETGPAHGEPLLLVMGLGCQLIHWPDSLCTQLAARGFRVIRFDNRDIGLSGEGPKQQPIRLQRDWLRSRFGLAIRANYTLHDMAADAVGLLDHFGLDRAHLAGVSMGGMIAQIVSGRYPQRVKSLTSIMSTTNHPRLPGPRLDVLLHMSKAGVNHAREAVAERNVRLFSMIGSPAFPTPEAQRREFSLRAYDRAYRPGGLLRQTHAIMATGSFEDLLPQVQAPTQIIHGLADPLVRPAGGKRSAQLIRNARLELIEGMGHDFPEPLMPRWTELIAANAARA
jgi:pimeloyl-ACP methyl ester carboxylesterase